MLSEAASIADSAFGRHPEQKLARRLTDPAARIGLASIPHGRGAQRDQHASRNASIGLGDQSIALAFADHLREFAFVVVQLLSDRVLAEARQLPGFLHQHCQAGALAQILDVAPQCALDTPVFCHHPRCGQVGPGVGNHVQQDFHQEFVFRRDVVVERSLQHAYSRRHLGERSRMVSPIKEQLASGAQDVSLTVR